MDGGKTRVSIFVSHNKKLNCLFKELIKDESIKGYRKRAHDAKKQIEEEYKKICSEPPEQWERSNCLKCPDAYIDRCWDAIERQQGGAVAPTTSWDAMGVTEERVKKYWGENKSPLKITINGEESIYEPMKSLFRYLKEGSTEEKLTFNKDHKTWAFSPGENSLTKYILIPNTDYPWLINKFGLISSDVWKVYEKGKKYAEFFDITIKIETQEGKDTSTEGSDISGEEESFDCINPPPSTTIEKCKEECNGYDFSQCELSVRLNNASLEREKEAKAEIRKKEEEETFSKLIESKDTPHFINGAVIKLEYKKGDLNYTIELINSSKGDILDEIKKNKVEHTKDGHEVWCSNPGDSYLYLTKDKGDGISKDEKIYEIASEEIHDIKLKLREFKIEPQLSGELIEEINGIKDIDHFILYFVRHGEGWHNRKSKEPVHMLDSNLTVKGIADGMHAALTIHDDLIKNHKVDFKDSEFKFFTSDLHRSQQTNDIIYRFLKFQGLFKQDDCLYQVPCLHEIDGNCHTKPSKKPSSTPFNPYEPKYWPNDEKAWPDDDIYNINAVILKGDPENRYVEKILGDKKDTDNEYEKEITNFLKNAVTLLYYKPQSVNKWEYYPNEDDEEYNKKMREIEKYKGQDPDMYNIMETLVKLECRDYEDEQKRRKLFQNPKIAAATAAAAVASSPVTIPAAAVGAIGFKGLKKMKKMKGNKKGGALETAVVATGSLAASAVGATYAKYKNKRSHCNSFPMDQQLQYLMMIGITWSHWSEPFGLQAELGLGGGGIVRTDRKKRTHNKRSNNKRSNRSNNKRSNRSNNKRSNRSNNKRSNRRTLKKR